MSYYALKAIQEAKESRAKTLYLGNAGMSGLPDELFELTDLEVLVLSVVGWYQDTETGENIQVGFFHSYDYNWIHTLNPKMGQLKNLKVLLLCAEKYAWDLYDLSPLKDLVNLEQLELRRIVNEGILDLSPLKDLVNLRRLRLAELHLDEPLDLSPLKNLKKLESLSIYCNAVRDLSPLADLQNLEYLNLDSVRVSDLSPLKNLKNLRTLGLDCNEIVDLSPLSNLKNLRDLSVHSVRVTDISPLSNLQNLEYLGIGMTAVRDLSPLKDLVNLKKIDITWADSITNPPLAVAEEGIEAIRRYFKEHIT